MIEARTRERLAVSARAFSTNARNRNLRRAQLSFAAAWTGEIKVKGTATIRGQKVEHEGRPGAILWPVKPQQNFATWSRLERQLVLAGNRDVAHHAVVGDRV